jgi:hypothetical protein
MHIKQQAMMETVNRLLHFNQELSRTLLSIVPNPNDQIHRDGMSSSLGVLGKTRSNMVPVIILQGEIQRQSELIRQMDEPHEPPLSSSRQFFANIDNPPVSPRQLAQDDQRRLNVPQSRAASFYRPQVPSSLSISSRRPYGSIGGGPTLGASVAASSPLRNQAPPPPAEPHPLATVEPPPGNLARRHTSADIRAHGWQPTPPPFVTSGPPSSHWPSSPNRLPQEDQGLRDSLSQYSLQTASQRPSLSRPATPPPPPFSNGISGMDSLNSWSWGSSNRENKNLALRDLSSGPPTRRGSMAHILNPTDIIERDDEDDPRGDDDRKRKRMQ